MRGRYKLIRYFEYDSVRLYDLEHDQGEQKDLAPRKPELVKQLRADLEAWLERTKAPVPTKPNLRFGG